MSSNIGVCPKCFRVTVLTRHHIFPQRFFGHKNNQAKIYLCRKCHDVADKLTPYRKKLTKEEYVKIHKNWIREGTKWETLR